MLERARFGSDWLKTLSVKDREFLVGQLAGNAALQARFEEFLNEPPPQRWSLAREYVHASEAHYWLEVLLQKPTEECLRLVSNERVAAWVLPKLEKLLHLSHGSNKQIIRRMAEMRLPGDTDERAAHYEDDQEASMEHSLEVLEVAGLLKDVVPKNTFGSYGPHYGKLEKLFLSALCHGSTDGEQKQAVHAHALDSHSKSDKLLVELRVIQSISRAILSEAVDPQLLARGLSSGIIDSHRNDLKTVQGKVLCSEMVQNAESVRNEYRKVLKGEGVVSGVPSDIQRG